MLILPIKKKWFDMILLGEKKERKNMRRCDLFYKKAMGKENWKKDDLCDPPTEPRDGIHILIDELLGENWYVAMPESDNQVITQAIYQIIQKYIDEPKKKEQIWGIIIIICALINIITFIIR